MSGQCKCGSYAINDDPERVLCDKCWRDAEIERLREECECYEGMKEGFAIRIADAERERDECRRLLLQVADEWDRMNRNKPGNRPIAPIVLLREWREAARAAGEANG